MLIMPPIGLRNSNSAAVSGSENGSGPAKVSEQGFKEAPLFTSKEWKSFSIINS